MTGFNRTTRLRLRRVFRRRRKQVEQATQSVETQFDTNLIDRFDRLFSVRRFISGWLLLVVLVTVCTVIQTVALSGYYQTVRPVPGGTFNEGIVGTYSNASPLYAMGAVDTAVSHLVFAGLLKYNDKNQLTGDLASSYKVNDTGRRYTVTLRPNLTWQDGQPLTAEDVVFTYKLIQNADAHSPLFSSWQGITVTAPTTMSVQFDLPSVLSSFPYSLTNGLVPKHLLAAVPAAQLRSNSFNTIHPVGAGPFAWQALQAGNSSDPAKATSLIALQPFTKYAGGQPKLGGFVVRTYPNDELMVQAYENRDINAMSGLESLPTSLRTQNDDAVLYNMPSTAALMTFFKNSSGVLADIKVRQALVQGSDVPAIMKQLDYATRAVQEPLLQTQLGYDAKYAQAAYNPVAANASLDAAGWIRGANGKRLKNGQPLSFRIYAENTPENKLVLHSLVANWNALGVTASTILQPLSDFQTTLEFHTYDALLYGISIGVDPDVFAYWDSSQADVRANNRLNFSEYKSSVADAALESGRTRLDPTLRTVKYRPFLQAWQQDAPALGLYQPRFLYVSRGTIAGLSEHTLNTDTDRYSSVANWEIHTARVTN